MNKLIKIIVAGIIINICGCASIAGDNNRTVIVKSKPAGAKVYANNIPVGTTPTQISINNTWSPTLLTFKKKGYEDTSAQVNTAFQPLGILNVFFWPGFIVDAATGNMMKVSPESRMINANLKTVV